ncbi:MAG: phosphoadenylyl-sulfate reductase [Bacteroidales bacterium]|nr:phosphoadenylyl-sulfate reductase [Bacteroidales bacterium]
MGGDGRCFWLPHQCHLDGLLAWREGDELGDGVAVAGRRFLHWQGGRFFPETYQLIDKTNLRYGIKLEVFCPQTEALQQMVRDNGINLFYESIEKRHLCCQVRKLEPLSRAFRTLDAWVCGLRRAQSVTRSEMRLVEWDDAHGLLKVNPLIEWSEAQVWEYVRSRHVPYNQLHDKGYPSIGCEPCTRPVKPGDDIRSGRWWWEDPQHRECGLHAKH